MGIFWGKAKPQEVPIVETLYNFDPARLLDLDYWSRVFQAFTNSPNHAETTIPPTTKLNFNYAISAMNLILLNPEHAYNNQREAFTAWAEWLIAEQGFLILMEINTQVNPQFLGQPYPVHEDPRRFLGDELPIMDDYDADQEHVFKSLVQFLLRTAKYYERSIFPVFYIEYSDKNTDLIREDALLVILSEIIRTPGVVTDLSNGVLVSRPGVNPKEKAWQRIERFTYKLFHTRVQRDHHHQFMTIDPHILLLWLEAMFITNPAVSIPTAKKIRSIITDLEYETVIAIMSTAVSPADCQRLIKFIIYEQDTLTLSSALQILDATVYISASRAKTVYKALLLQGFESQKWPNGFPVHDRINFLLKHLDRIRHKHRPTTRLQHIMNSEYISSEEEKKGHMYAVLDVCANPGKPVNRGEPRVTFENWKRMVSCAADVRYDKRFINWAIKILMPNKIATSEELHSEMIDALVENKPLGMAGPYKRTSDRSSNNW